MAEIENISIDGADALASDNKRVTGGAPDTTSGPAKVKAAGGAPTPMMAQYLEIKQAHPDDLLFYRMGDFYEMFFGDAEQAAAALDITLTKRGKHQGADIPMCGVPVHAAESYLSRLIRRGIRVAVCEQTEAPAEAKKRGAKSVVRREVVPRRDIREQSPKTRCWIHAVIITSPPSPRLAVPWGWPGSTSRPARFLRNPWTRTASPRHSRALSPANCWCPSDSPADPEFYDICLPTSSERWPRSRIPAPTARLAAAGWKKFLRSKRWMRSVITAAPSWRPVAGSSPISN
jgi:hypothetical protein